MHPQWLSKIWQTFLPVALAWGWRLHAWIFPWGKVTIRCNISNSSIITSPHEYVSLTFAMGLKDLYNLGSVGDCLRQYHSSGNLYLIASRRKCVPLWQSRNTAMWSHSTEIYGAFSEIVILFYHMGGGKWHFPERKKNHVYSTLRVLQLSQKALLPKVEESWKYFKEEVPRNKLTGVYHLWHYAKSAATHAGPARPHMSNR